MKDIRLFLESSSIHGLTYISSTRTYARLFWVVVVITGFIGAGVIIYQSFKAWDESPVTTTVETLPITEMTFPIVTVCPPKKTYTDLNLDLVRTRNMTLNNDTRNELLSFAVDLLQRHLYESAMTNLSVIQEENRYYNWYHGHTQIRLPDPHSTRYGVSFQMYTSATSGSIWTRHFGEIYNAGNIDTDIYSKIEIYPPRYISQNKNFTLNFEIEKVPMKNLLSGEEKLTTSENAIGSNIRNITVKYAPPAPSPYSNYYVLGPNRYIQFRRKISREDVKKINQDLTPGFQIKWFYTNGSGIVEVNLDSKWFYNDEITKLFARNGSDMSAEYFLGSATIINVLKLDSKLKW